MKLFFLFISIFFLVFERLHAQTQAKDFQAFFSRWEQDTNTRTASLGFCAAYIGDTTEEIFAYQPDRSLIPASTLKLTTTLTALEVLGTDFRFQTLLEHNGFVDTAGILHGDLFLTGGGDPSLAYPDEKKLWEEWYKALQKAGIQSVQGRIIADARYFDEQMTPGTWTWEDLGNYYGAGVSGLNFHRNEYALFFQTGAPETAATFLRIEPELPELQLIHELTAGTEGSGDNSFIYGSPYTYLRYIRGSIAPNRSSFRVRGALPDPAKQAAESFLYFLKQKNIPVSGGATTYRLLRGQTPPDQIGKKILARTLSQPLSALTQETNRHSLNLYAEAFLKMIGRELARDPSQQAAAEALKNWWAAQGLDMQGFFMEDGSGLSRYNALTTRQQVQMLAWAFKRPYFETLYAGLPIAGVSGSLRHFAKGTRAANNLRAKSGYLRRVKGYTGYVQTRSGRWVAFSMIVNHYALTNAEMNRQLERLMVLLAELD